jgi:uncharacterized protein (TIGR01777 family)
MKIWIAGATGLVGAQLSLELIKKGHELVISSRRPADTWRSIAGPHQSIHWPPKADEHEFLSNLDAVINLSGENIAAGRWSPDRKKKIVDSRIDGVKEIYHVLEQCQSSPKTFINASATGFYGDRGDEILNERSTPGQGFLADTCQAWEKEVFHPKQNDLFSQTRKVALRIGLVLSRRGGALDKMLPAFQSHVGGPLGSGKQWMSWIHEKDLIHLLIFALENSYIEGPLIACSPKPISNRDFSQTLSQQLNKWMAPPAPSFGLKWILGEMSQLVLQSQRVEPIHKELDEFKWSFPDLKTALEDLLGGAPQTAHQLEAVQWVPRPIDEIFQFFCDEKNLELITPNFLNFKVLGKDSAEIGEGTKIKYQLKLHGIPIGWESEITQWDPPHQFVDRQLKGPYKTWHHTHYFESMCGGTLMGDKVRYELNFGPLGRAVQMAWVKGDVEKIFRHRQEVIQHRFGTS